MALGGFNPSDSLLIPPPSHLTFFDLTKDDRLESVDESLNDVQKVIGFAFSHLLCEGLTFSS